MKQPQFLDFVCMFANAYVGRIPQLPVQPWAEEKKKGVFQLSTHGTETSCHISQLTLSYSNMAMENPCHFRIYRMMFPFKSQLIGDCTASQVWLQNLHQPTPLGPWWPPWWHLPTDPVEWTSAAPTPCGPALVRCSGEVAGKGNNGWTWWKPM